ncbi:MAG: YceI family protein [Bacteroidetes bacterium]|nr:MAG: YceI family protein [Bacteroidota bacterium]
MKVKLVLLFVLSAFFAFGQSSFRTASVKMTIKGSSNLHDWESDVTEVRASGTFVLNDAGLQSIDALDVTIPVKSIKSSKGSIMDGKTYKALNADKYPNITFKLSKATVTNKGDKNDVNASGSLSIAGKSRTISLYVRGSESNGRLTFSGSEKLKMTDYGIEPPTALLGTMTVGDEVEIVFTLTLKPS